MVEGVGVKGVVIRITLIFRVLGKVQEEPWEEAQEDN